MRQMQHLAQRLDHSGHLHLWMFLHELAHGLLQLELLCRSKGFATLVHHQVLKGFKSPAHRHDRQLLTVEDVRRNAGRIDELRKLRQEPGKVV